MDAITVKHVKVLTDFAVDFNLFFSDMNCSYKNPLLLSKTVASYVCLLSFVSFPRIL